MRLSIHHLALLPLAVGCGASVEEPTRSQGSAVQDGESDTARTHNFAVGIASKEGAICSGTLIAPNLVLTARHCVIPVDDDTAVTCSDTFPTKNVDPSTLFVTTAPVLRGARNFYSVKRITTPTANGFCGNDIAVITLTANIPSFEAVPATPVVQFSIADRSRIGTQIAAMGYGITSPTADDSGTRRVREQIEIVCVPGDDAYDCNRGEYRDLVDSDREFITEGYVCSGDSGGGAFDQASFTRGVPYVLGALSRGPQTEERCLAAIYSRTDAHAAMIISAGEKAATEGKYARPSWLTAKGDLLVSGTTCVGEECASDEAAAPPPIKVRRETSGCTATTAPASPESLALMGLALVLAAARRRQS